MCLRRCRVAGEYVAFPRSMALAHHLHQISKGERIPSTAQHTSTSRTDALNAASYNFGVKATVPFLRYNNFAGHRGRHFGAIRCSSTSTSTRSYTSVHRADFVRCRRWRCEMVISAGQKTIYDPATQPPNSTVVTRQAFLNNQNSNAR